MTKTTKTPAERRAYFVDAATEAFNNGFTSKSAAKRAMDDVSRAFDLIDRELKDACLDLGRGDDMPAAANVVYWDFPSYPHQFKAKHIAMVRDAFGDRFDALMVEAGELAALREAIKSAPVVPPVKDETKAIANRIVETIRARMDRLNVRYLEAIDLTTVFEDGFVMKGLSANSHYVTNDHGTTFLRTFFYLNGKLTPLNLILAAAQEARRQAEA